MLKGMKSLIEELNMASSLYYNGGNSPLSDKEFDAKLKLLQEYEKNTGIIYAGSPSMSVGAKILDNLKKISIADKPMLSLDKCHSEEEIISFAREQKLVASVKCDGLSVRIIYENGEIVSANTRGNGIEGQDITEHIKMFTNVPLSIPEKEKLVVDGEAIIYKADFDKINQTDEFKNPRNLAAGTLSSLRTSLCKDRRLSFILWDVIECSKDTNSYSERLDYVKSFGFTIVPNKIIDTSVDTVSTVTIEGINDSLKERAIGLGIPYDGIVWKYDDISFEEGRTAHHFLNAIAFKFKDDEYDTTLLNIEWSMGRTGQITPVAIYEEVEADGSVLSRANVHNLSILEEIFGVPHYLQKIRVFKANSIIPQVSWADKEYDKTPYSHLPFLPPDRCPICGEPLSIKDNNGVKTLWCENSSCEGKIANIINHYCSRDCMNIKGLSKATIEKLVDKGWLNSIEDIYTLKDHKEEWLKMAGFGEKSVSNILNSIEESKKCKLENFIAALGIKLIGAKVSAQIAEFYPTWEDFRDAVGGEWSCIGGFGAEMERALNNFDYSEADNIAHMLDFQEKIEDTQKIKMLSNFTIVLTGKMSKPRKDIEEDIKAAGGKIGSSVSQKTQYVVCNDKSSTTGKSADAKRYNIPVITEEELYNMLNA